MFENGICVGNGGGGVSMGGQCMGIPSRERCFHHVFPVLLCTINQLWSVVPLYDLHDIFSCIFGARSCFSAVGWTVAIGLTSKDAER